VFRVRPSGEIVPLDWKPPEGFTLETVLPDGRGGLYLVAALKTLRRAQDGTLHPFADVGSPAGAVALARDGSFYCAQAGNLRRVSAAGEVSIVAEGLGQVFGIALSEDGVPYVTDWEGGRVLRVGPDGTEIVARGLSYPSGLLFDREGRLVVKESGRMDGRPMRLRRIERDGSVTTLATLRR
jgi:sugar lactone lactonase YvrE